MVRGLFSALAANDQPGNKFAADAAGDLRPAKTEPEAILRFPHLSHTTSRRFAACRSPNMPFYTGSVSRGGAPAKTRDVEHRSND